MTLLTAIILGLVQGLTEFLPVSSSGHLVLSQYLLGFKGPSLAFDVMLHLGTTLAVLIYFRKDIAEIFVSALKGSSQGQGRRWIVMIVIATIPTVIIALAFKDQFERMFDDPQSLAVQFWITALLLLVTDRVRVRSNPDERIKTHQSLLVGVAQGISIIPAISRSGLTISAGVFSGMNRETAARFSFLLSIPAILGACLLEAKDIAGIAATELLFGTIGTLVAFVSGYLAIDLMLKMVVKRDLWIFAVYLFFIGLVAFIVI
jgi:undecaprenyl-diphosphatase